MSNTEQSVIGAILIDDRVIDDVVSILQPDDFQEERHQAIYSEMMKMMEKGKNIDVITVAESLGSSGNLDRCGGLKYLTSLAKNTPTAANVKQYAGLVQERSTTKRLSQVATEIGYLANDITLKVGERLERAQQMIEGLATRGLSSGPVFVGDILKRVVENLDERLSSGGGVVGLSTGYTELDARTNGLKKQDLIILAGRPSMGKTTLAMNIAENVALDDKAVAVFSMEMSDESLMDRSLASVGRIPLRNILNGKLNDEEWTKVTYVAGQMMKTRLYIDQTPALTVLEIKARSRKLKRKNGLDLIVVDYLQLMSGSGENRTNIVSEISRGLKTIAKELDVPVIALSQLNRSLEQRSNKKPMMSDLRESGAIEQDADLIWFVYRDEVYDKETPNKGVAEIITAKQRNGETGSDLLTFQGHLTRFDNFSGMYIEKEDRPNKMGFDG